VKNDTKSKQGGKFMSRFRGFFGCILVLVLALASMSLGTLAYASQGSWELTVSYSGDAESTSAGDNIKSFLNHTPFNGGSGNADPFYGNVDLSTFSGLGQVEVIGSNHFLGSITTFLGGGGGGTSDVETQVATSEDNAKLKLTLTWVPANNDPLTNPPPSSVNVTWTRKISQYVSSAAQGAATSMETGYAYAYAKVEGWIDNFHPTYLFVESESTTDTIDTDDDGIVTDTDTNTITESLTVANGSVSREFSIRFSNAGQVIATPSGHEADMQAWLKLGVDVVVNNWTP
jgi:hypothetical protein